MEKIRIDQILQMLGVMASKVKTGRDSEVLAEHYFLSQGLRILLRRNYRCKGGEIDLIFEERFREDDWKNFELVFVEVRSRFHGSWLNGVESVDLRKRQRLSHAIRHFLMNYQGKAKTLRFDILAWDGKTWVHLKNALLHS